uniref:Uncharacterized protein n=1 Tax=Anguilla anguilla TaxID=7936 RepID=A0A0E9U543_ANGAN
MSVRSITQMSSRYFLVFFIMSWSLFHFLFKGTADSAEASH